MSEFDSFCSRAFRCAGELLVCPLSTFFLAALRAMSLPLKNAFIVSHKFGYVVASFSLNSKMSLISFFISPLTKLSLSRAFFSFHGNVDFLLVMLLLKISLSPWWSDRIHVKIFNISVSLEACFVSTYGQFWKKYHVVYPFVLR